MIHTRICDLFGIEHPLISAPMGGSAGGELAAAVSEAGGLGMIGGTSAGGADWLRVQIRAARERTARPFGVGFITAFPGVEALIEVALAERVPVHCHSFADPTPYVEAAHAAGATVIVQTQTVALALTAARAGADAIVAQGTEAGGHTGSTGTLALVPAVVDATDGLPVIAAGGIGDGRGLAAALLLGAEGAWLGTRFVASREWAGGEWAKERVVGAGADDTVLTHAYDIAARSPFPAYIGDRVLRNEFTDTWHGRDDEVAHRGRELNTMVRAAVAEGDPRLAPVRAGAASALISEIEPAAVIVQRIVREAESLLRTRSAALLR